MGQVNVNTPGGGGTAPASDGSGYGFIVGILVAVLVIVLLVWLLVFNGGNGGTNDDGDTLPSGYHLVYRA
ncbi:MAG TPA: hypothetical protein VFH90_01390 [Candidatus Limnocylindria bacterium]|nr:hypothetical protein [Candidatus Limnocylindria bacterium]